VLVREFQRRPEESRSFTSPQVTDTLPAKCGCSTRSLLNKANFRKINLLKPLVSGLRIDQKQGYSAPS
jgi:hypothetical protein